MKTIFAFLAFSFILLFAGCREETPTAIINPKIQDSVEIIIDTASIVLDYFCIEILKLDTNNYIINNDNEYFQILKFKFPWSKCDTYSLPEIDFSKYTLLGKKTYASSWAEYPKFKATLFKNIKQKKIIYHIDCTFIKDTISEFVGQLDMHWLKVPKIQSDYTVQIDTSVIIIWR